MIPSCKRPPQRVQPTILFASHSMRFSECAVPAVMRCVLTLEVSCCCQQLGLTLQRQRTQLADATISTWGVTGAGGRGGGEEGVTVTGARGGGCNSDISHQLLFWGRISH
jgi:hypothetical protein